MQEINASNMIHWQEWGQDQELGLPEPSEHRKGAHLVMDGKSFVRQHGIAIIAAAVFTLYTILLSAFVDYRAEKRVRAELAQEVQQQIAAGIQAHKDEQQQAQAAEYFLSGQASFEAYVNQEIDAVAPVIAKLSTDTQKYSETACMIARHMNPAYPNTFKDIAGQPQQWPLYDGKDKTFSQHDRDIAESLIRPYLESGKIPDGLTADMVYGAWSQNDFVLRDDYEGTGTMHTWRYQG